MRSLEVSFGVETKGKRRKRIWDTHHHLSWRGQEAGGQVESGKRKGKAPI